MRYSYFASRNRKEIMRDALTALLGIAMPLIFLIMFSLIGKRAPLDIFKAINLAPGMMVFGFTFLTMFSAILIAKDKKSAFLLRLFTSPLTAVDYIAGYALPMFPIALLQCVLCLVTAAFLGAPVTINMLITILVLIPHAVFSIFAGLLLGTLLTETQVQGVGSVYITFGALLGGAWMDLSMIGGIIKTVSYLLPFAHSIDAARAAMAGNYADIPIHLLWAVGYAVVIFILAVLAFKKIMRSDSK